MKKKKSPLIKLTKETPKSRKQRVSSGAKFRAAVFENKKQKLKRMEPGEHDEQY